MYTCESLAIEIKNLGVSSGDTVLVHSSYKSLGKMERGAETIVRALQEVITYQGLLLMPSFNLTKEGELKVHPTSGVLYTGHTRDETWDIEKSKSTVGWITEYFRQLPATYRSDNYSHSIGGWGRDSIPFLCGHMSNREPISPWDREPWGRTYGRDSPFYRAYEQSGKIMMLGDIPWSSCTYIHFIETLYWNILLESDDSARYPKMNLDNVGRFWMDISKKGDLDQFMNTGSVGDANCKLFQIRKFVDTVLESVKENPDRFLKK